MENARMSAGTAGADYYIDGLFPGGKGNEYKIVQVDSIGRPDIIYRGFYNYKHNYFTCYPARVLNYGIKVSVICLPGLRVKRRGKI